MALIEAPRPPEEDQLDLRASPELRTVEELIHRLDQTWPGEHGGEPKIIARPWVIWHLIEHDLHHGGENSITLGAHGISGVSL